MVPKNMSKNTLPSTQTSPLCRVNNVSQNLMSNKHLKCLHCNKTYKTETGLNPHTAKCKERAKLLTKTNTIYHVLVMATIQQLPKQSNILDCKWVMPSAETLSTQYKIKLYSGVKIFSFYSQATQVWMPVAGVEF